MQSYKEAIKGLDWWHTIELPDGTVTPGKTNYMIPENAERFQLPPDLSGNSVLDIGTFDGFWAIEARKRGAHAIAMDRWRPMLGTAALSLSAYNLQYWHSGDIDNAEIPGDLSEKFDLVLFYGVLYHLKNPVHGIQYAADWAVPGGLVIIETAVNQGKMAQFADSEVPLVWMIDEVHHNDPSNYCMPNTAGVIQLAKMAGLEQAGEPIYDKTQTRVGIRFKKL